MQHPDEGMIHSWLDGALSAEEAARVESHVGECASCAAAVAEARGFIAASSRILTALDNVPRGVLPAVPAKKRDFRIAWRAAAAVLIVAGGSFAVMREGGPDARITSRSEAVAISAVDQAAGALTASAPETEKAESTRDAAPFPSADAATTTPAPAAAPVASARRAESPGRTDLSAGADRGRAKVSVGEVAAATGAAAVPTAPNAIRMQMNEAPESDVALLRVVKVERTLGSRRTTYQVAPSETVTLTESEGDSTTAARIVLRGSTGAVASGRAERRTSASVPMSAEAANAAPPPPPVRMDSKGVTAFTAPSTITWIEARTGKTLTLSGNVSVERLQEIRKRIEKERELSGGKLP